MVGRKKSLAIAVASITILLLAGSFFLFTNSRHESGHNLKINDTKIHVEIADSETERQNGLCCRDSLGSDSGMLFVFSQPGNYRFWMKDTRIPLDMYWISEDKKIIHIEKNVQPETYPKSFGTDKPARYILETNAGFADKHGINIGDSVQF